MIGELSATTTMTGGAAEVNSSGMRGELRVALASASLFYIFFYLSVAGAQLARAHYHFDIFCKLLSANRNMGPERV